MTHLSGSATRTGSGTYVPPVTGCAGTLCLDPSDPSGPTIQRLSSRAGSFALDEDAATATVQRSHARAYAWFAGSTQPLADGHVMVGWASASLFAPMPIATEVDADDEVVWELRDPNPTYADRYSSHRAHLEDVPDATPPDVELDVDEGATYVEAAVVPVSFGCTDRGGSSLWTCDGSVGEGAALDTSRPGERAVAVVATDGAGNQTTVTRH